jgi:hypothetical protein
MKLVAASKHYFDLRFHVCVKKNSVMPDELIFSSYLVHVMLSTVTRISGQRVCVVGVHIFLWALRQLTHMMSHARPKIDWHVR